MLTEKFPIGFWQETETNKNSPETVKLWAELGMTLAMTAPFNEGDDPNSLIAVLDECERQGIKVIVRDNSVFWTGASTSPDNYSAKFHTAYEKFGHHPAVLGFYIGDEPQTNLQFEDCAAASIIQQKIAPELTPYINFLPYKADLSERIVGNNDYQAWLAGMVNKGGLKILSYDCYSHMRGDLEGVHTYFENLRRFTAAAKETGATPWNCILSSGHFTYRCPSENDLRWQLHTSVASGIKGITWFLIYSSERLCNFQLIPINEYDERTETFLWLSRVNRYFQMQYGEFFNRAEHISTYHLVCPFGGYELFKAGVEDDSIYAIESVNNVNGLVSFFSLDGERYLVLVNNTPDKNGKFKVKVKPSTKEYAELKHDGTFKPLRSSKVSGTDQADEYVCLFEEWDEWMGPGQMRVLKI